MNTYKINTLKCIIKKIHQTDYYHRTSALSFRTKFHPQIFYKLVNLMSKNTCQRQRPKTVVAMMFSVLMLGAAVNLTQELYESLSHTHRVHVHLFECRSTGQYLSSLTH